MRLPPTRDHLIEAIQAAQLIQFGRFQRGNTIWPVNVQLEMLPSYGEILSMAADQLAGFSNNVERLVCDIDSLPLALAISLRLSLPLVYSRYNVGIAPELVGAYDIGHPAILIVNSTGVVDHTQFVRSAGRVGLVITAIYALLDYGIDLSFPESQRLFTLEEYVDFLVSNNKLPAGQASSVTTWLAAQRSLTRHPRG